jgi:uncharacterized cupredoxin-like copper-binding protein
MTRLCLVIALLALLGPPPAFAQLGELKSFLEGTASERIDIELKDFAFAPQRIALKKGKTYRLVLKNTGPVLHYFGSKEFQEAVEVLGVVSDGVTRPPTRQAHFPVNPGDSKTLFVRPRIAGVVPLTCFIPTHVFFGMSGTIEVVE